jgi:hypothetical protein
MVLKTGPDRPVQPVQPQTGAQSGPVLQKNRKNGKIDQKPETAGSTGKTANRSGWTGFGPVRLIPKLHRFGLLFLDPNQKMHELSWQCEEIEGEREITKSLRKKKWRLRKIEERRKQRVAYSGWWRRNIVK